MEIYKKIFSTVHKIIQLILMFIIYLYKLIIDPFIGKNCRFYPSCSQYSLEAINSKGVLMGMYLTIKRLIKCHKWNKGGYNPVLK